MRRQDREIADDTRINEIIAACHCCRLGFNDGGKVYIVPLSFGFEEAGGKRVFYFHGATEGRKIDLIEKTHRAGFELDTHYRLNEADVACGYSARFQSVIGTGRVELIQGPEEKRHGLQCLMQSHTGKDNWEIPAPMLATVCVFKLEVEEISCKEHQ